MNAIPTNIVAINSMESLKHELRLRRAHHLSRVKQGRRKLAYVPPILFWRWWPIVKGIVWNEGGASECARIYNRIVELEKGNG